MGTKNSFRIKARHTPKVLLYECGSKTEQAGQAESWAVR